MPLLNTQPPPVEYMPRDRRRTDVIGFAIVLSCAGLVALILWVVR